MTSVQVERTIEGGFRARNQRGAEVSVGDSEQDGSFTPVELLLAALGGCEIVSIEPLTAKRGHRLVRLESTVTAEKVAPTRLGQITVTYEIELPEGDEKAAEVFTDVARRVHESYCTVGNALKVPTAVEQILPSLDGPPTGEPDG
ncbi:OsmC family protein [Actinomadura sp. HBU206391]|uniref:OsmC family protein n=1 Tax=Actinomadura sp. HBU206391 TaxID=2731692 RepID=UPI001650C203|nr:OsmC family protein [Actinomadura sp. HBU206391]MBC6461597.1 OsmC family protein [Actinomadura sp. HBU206391]